MKRSPRSDAIRRPWVSCGSSPRSSRKPSARRSLNAMIASQASPVGFVRELIVELGADAEITRKEFFEHGVRFATGYSSTVAGTAAQVADHMEEVFEATGSRGGFMLGHVVSMPGDLTAIADLLVPELQRRGRFRREYKGTTLRENLFDDD